MEFNRGTNPVDALAGLVDVQVENGRFCLEFGRVVLDGDLVFVPVALLVADLDGVRELSVGAVGNQVFGFLVAVNHVQSGVRSASIEGPFDGDRGGVADFCG